MHAPRRRARQRRRHHRDAVQLARGGRVGAGDDLQLARRAGGPQDRAGVAARPGDHSSSRHGPSGRSKKRLAAARPAARRPAPPARARTRGRRRTGSRMSAKDARKAGSSAAAIAAAIAVALGRHVADVRRPRAAALAVADVDHRQLERGRLDDRARRVADDGVGVARAATGSGAGRARRTSRTCGPRASSASIASRTARPPGSSFGSVTITRAVDFLQRRRQLVGLRAGVGGAQRRGVEGDGEQRRRSSTPSDERQLVARERFNARIASSPAAPTTCTRAGSSPSCTIRSP